MSAISNILRLLMVFEDDKRVYTADELSEILGVSTRQIRNYITEMRRYGYVIEGVVAKGGGYRSAGQYLNLPLSVTESEIMSLARTINFISQNDIFSECDNLKNLYYKLIRQKKLSINYRVNFDYRLQYRQIHKTTEKSIIHAFLDAIEKNNTVRIKYYSAKSQSLNERIIHPYKLQLYQGANYLHAYCEKADDYRVFKLIRIQGFEVLQQTFSRDSIIVKKLKNQNFGIFNEKSYSVKLEFRYPFNEFAKEVILGNNQTVEVIDDKLTVVSAQVTNETELISWILGFGEGVFIIEPRAWKKAIVEKASNIISSYEDN